MHRTITADEYDLKIVTNKRCSRWEYQLNGIFEFLVKCLTGCAQVFAIFWLGNILCVFLFNRACNLKYVIFN